MFHNINLRICEILRSLPSRERGLKLNGTGVTELVITVAPFAGAWIETQMISDVLCTQLSLPSRERGLKHLRLHHPAKSNHCRSLRGSVD